MSPEELYEKLVDVFPGIDELINWEKENAFTAFSLNKNVELDLVGANYVKKEFELQCNFDYTSELIINANLTLKPKFIQVNWINTYKEKLPNKKTQKSNWELVLLVDANEGIFFQDRSEVEIGIYVNKIFWDKLSDKIKNHPSTKD